MISAVVAFAIVQQTPYFERAFPNPTGNNGWEEYVMAADIMRGPEANRAVNRYIIGSDKWDDSIESARKTVAKYQRACELMRIGNRKPLAYPWKEDEFGMPNDPVETEYSAVVKLIADEVRVNLADGKPEAAADSLLTGLVFAERYSHGSMIEALKGSAFIAMSLGSLSKHLHRFDLEGLQRVLAEFERQASREPILIKHLIEDFDDDLKEARAVFDSIEEDAEFFEVPEQMFNLTPAQKAIYIALIDKEMLRVQAKVREMFELEERFWRNPILEHPDPVVSYAIGRNLYENLPMIAVRNRTQLRLASLHCRVMAFKRTHNRFPLTREELGDKDLWYDPASGGLFYYAKNTDQSFTLYSTGTPETGRIDLVWKFPRD